MTDLNSPLAPAADVGEALRADLREFLDRRTDTPRTFAQIAHVDDPGGWPAQQLIDAVGSTAQVEDLHDRPHIDEATDQSAVHAGDRQRIDEVVRLIASDSPVPRAEGDWSVYEHLGLDELRPRLPWCDPEYRTIALRILRTLALDPARPLHRRIAPERLAAAIMWIALTASDAFARSQNVKPSMLWDWFKVSSCSKIARELADQVRVRNASLNPAGEVDLRDDQSALGEITLGDSSMLHSAYRRSLVEHRDDLLDRAERRRLQELDAHPLILNGLQERFGFRSRPVTVRWAMRGEDEETGRACVSVAFGEGLGDMEIVGLSVPDARRLIDALQHALDAPIIT